MAWVVVVGDDQRPAECSQPFDELADATLYAIDLADTLGRITPFTSGRTVKILNEHDFTELCFAVLCGGLIHEDD